MRVTVIGAGVVGLATAMELCERGAEVTILERSADSGTAPAHGSPAACSLPIARAKARPRASSNAA